jgi:DNA-binding SARP family transcriptional activator/Tfp pilus assembly protein PilF
VEFRVLGPVEIVDGPRTIRFGPNKQRILLAVLLCHANREVTRDVLIDTLWSRPPRTAADNLRVHVYHLRRELGAERVVRHPGGYSLLVKEGELDSETFTERVEEGSRTLASGNADDAARTLRAALNMWRGPAFGDLRTVEPLRTRAEHLDELRLDALAQRIDADLTLGQHNQITGELATLAAEHPLRERFQGRLLLALYRGGRSAEALQAFDRYRRRLSLDLGVEPGAELQALHLAILRDDPDLVPTSLPAVAAGPQVAKPRPSQDKIERLVPRQLPGDVAGFTGRSAELAQLDALLRAESDDAPRTVVISTIAGAAGVGKTALAVRWAHQVRDQFPDGQLYINLRGYDPDQPITTAEALARFLAALGVTGQDIPLEMDERAARYRTEIAERRMLIVLDNAATVEQVRPLLPGTPSCAVVVTSRDRLAGLVARHGAHRLELDLLSPDDAVMLLRTLIGERVDSEPLPAQILAERCSRLPLALRIAAEFVAARPQYSLQALTEELNGERRRLEILDADGDERTAVRAVFSWSYRNLPADTARAFRLLGLHPGRDFDAYVVAALAGTTLEHAAQMLDTLAGGHLVHQRNGDGRYDMHDLTRAYAAHLLGDDSDRDRQTAVYRLLDHYLATARRAAEVLYPAATRPPHPPPSSAPAPPIADPISAKAWLDGERPNLLAIAAIRGWPGHTAQLAAVLWPYLKAGGYLADARTVQVNAIEAARQIGDRASEATALTNLGSVYWTWGRYERAADRLQQALTIAGEGGNRAAEARALHHLGAVHWQRGMTENAVRSFQQALTITRETGDSTLEASALNNLGHIFQRQGRYEEAFDHFKLALAIARRTGNRINEAWTLDSLGDTYQRQGDYERAFCAHQRALAIGVEIGDRAREATALGNLGIVYTRWGDHRRATERLQRALAVAREIGDRDCEARTLGYLGAVHEQTANYDQAFDHHLHALAIAREIGHRGREVAVLNDLGRAAHAAGLHNEAQAHHESALTRAEDIDDRYEQARAHDGIAVTMYLDGRCGQARRHWLQALARYTELNLPQADEIRSKLADLGREDDQQHLQHAVILAGLWRRSCGERPRSSVYLGPDVVGTAPRS